MSDLLISGSSNKELKTIIDNIENEHNVGYIQFLEEQLEKAEEKINELKTAFKKKKYPGYCIECFNPLVGDKVICGKCQDECDGRWDHLRE